MFFFFFFISFGLRADVCVCGGVCVSVLCAGEVLLVQVMHEWWKRLVYWCDLHLFHGGYGGVSNESFILGFLFRWHIKCSFPLSWVIAFFASLVSLLPSLFMFVSYHFCENKDMIWYYIFICCNYQFCKKLKTSSVRFIYTFWNGNCFATESLIFKNT